MICQNTIFSNDRVILPKRLELLELSGSTVLADKPMVHAIMMLILVFLQRQILLILGIVIIRTIKSTKIIDESQCALKSRLVAI